MSMERVDQIRRELRELDLARSQCPVDQRRYQREAEEQAREAQEVQEQKRTANWWTAIDQRIQQHIASWWGEAGDNGTRDRMVDAIGEVIGCERNDRRQEVKKAIEKERRSSKQDFGRHAEIFEAKTEAAVAKHERAATEMRAKIPGIIEEAVARHVAQAMANIRQPAAAIEAERRSLKQDFDRNAEIFEAKTKAAIASCERAAVELRSSITVIIEQAVTKAMANSDADRKEVKAAIEAERRSSKADFDKHAEVSEAKTKAAIASCERAAVELRSRIPAMIDEAVAKHVALAMKAALEERHSSKEDFEKVFEANVKAAVATYERDAAEMRSRIPAMVDEAVAKAMANIRQPADGTKGEKGDAGTLPMVQPYISGKIYYRSNVVAHATGTYQAKHDTVNAPTESADWTCIARAGRDGLSPTVRGTYNLGETYACLDIVALDGASFIAKRDDPGICPGDGWQLMSRQGRPGRKGEMGERGVAGPKGDKGAPGEAVPQIVSFNLDRPNYRFSTFLSDGKIGPELALRELFVQFMDETGAGSPEG